MRLRFGIDSDEDAEFLAKALQASSPSATSTEFAELLADITCGGAEFVGQGDPYEIGVVIRVEADTAVLSNLYSTYSPNSMEVWHFFRRVTQYLKQNGFTRMMLAVTHDQPKAVRTMRFYKNRLGFDLHGVILAADVDKVARAWGALPKVSPRLSAASR